MKRKISSDDSCDRYLVPVSSDTTRNLEDASQDDRIDQEVAILQSLPYGFVSGIVDYTLDPCKFAQLSKFFYQTMEKWATQKIACFKAEHEVSSDWDHRLETYANSKLATYYQGQDKAIPSDRTLPKRFLLRLVDEIPLSSQELPLPWPYERSTCQRIILPNGQVVAYNEEHPGDVVLTPPLQGNDSVERFEVLFRNGCLFVFKYFGKFHHIFLWDHVGLANTPRIDVNFCQFDSDNGNGLTLDFDSDDPNKLNVWTWNLQTMTVHHHEDISLQGTFIPGPDTPERRIECITLTDTKLVLSVYNEYCKVFPDEGYGIYVFDRFNLHAGYQYFPCFDDCDPDDPANCGDINIESLFVRSTGWILYRDFSSGVDLQWRAISILDGTKTTVELPNVSHFSSATSSRYYVLSPPTCETECTIEEYEYDDLETHVKVRTIHTGITLNSLENVPVGEIVHRVRCEFPDVSVSEADDGLYCVMSFGGGENFHLPGGFSGEFYRAHPGNTIIQKFSGTS